MLALQRHLDLRDCFATLLKGLETEAQECLFKLRREAHYQLAALCEGGMRRGRAPTSRSCHAMFQIQVVLDIHS